MENPLLYQIGITLIPGIGDVNGKRLISYCGSAEAVFKSSRKALSIIPGMGDSLVNNILSQKVLERAEKEIKFIERNDIRALYYQDENFPQRLLNCYDHPLMLYYKGNADLNHSRIVAFVGTRNATDYGKTVCRELIDGLSGKDVLLISGLAYGIDSCAHRHSLESGIPTVGVLGHGLDKLYPSQNRKLSNEMIENGGLLTDFMSETKPDRENFPKRNRIVAGMSDAVIVVESDQKGGALITAELANSYNRDVFAVPGRLGDTYSRGCNFFIKTNKAALIQSAEDIAYIMGWDDKRERQQIQTELFVQLSEEEKVLFSLLSDSGTLSVDKLVIHSGITPSKVAAGLLNLEFKGLVQTLPGKQYKAL
ncbi:MAG: DNA-protecting protein DprA [Bacteroidales bacterium]|nr:DNA-protecting protein DprA [Bacteroidales bacterium]